MNQYTPARPRVERRSPATGRLCTLSGIPLQHDLLFPYENCQNRPIVAGPSPRYLEPGRHEGISDRARAEQASVAPDALPEGTGYGASLQPVLKRTRLEEGPTLLGSLDQPAAKPRGIFPSRLVGQSSGGQGARIAPSWPPRMPSRRTAVGKARSTAIALPLDRTEACSGNPPAHC